MIPRFPIWKRFRIFQGMYFELSNMFFSRFYKPLGNASFGNFLFKIDQTWNCVLVSVRGYKFLKHLSSSFRNKMEAKSNFYRSYKLVFYLNNFLLWTQELSKEANIVQSFMINISKHFDRFIPSLNYWIYP